VEYLIRIAKHHKSCIVLQHEAVCWSVVESLYPYQPT